jgi:hypothetical protein
MLGNFTYENPCRVHFGPNALDDLPGELAKFGPKVLLTYGGGSIKRNGLYDKVISALAAAGKTVVEVPGVMSNPTADKLREGARVARENDVDLILAVGGGSTIDYAKGVSVSAWTEGDPWEHLYLHMEQPYRQGHPRGRRAHHERHRLRRRTLAQSSPTTSRASRSATSLVPDGDAQVCHREPRAHLHRCPATR